VADMVSMWRDTSARSAGALLALRARLARAERDRSRSDRWSRVLRLISQVPPAPTRPPARGDGMRHSSPISSATEGCVEQARPMRHCCAVCRGLRNGLKAGDHRSRAATASSGKLRGIILRFGPHRILPPARTF